MDDHPLECVDTQKYIYVTGICKKMAYFIFDWLPLEYCTKDYHQDADGVSGYVSLELPYSKKNFGG